jgi:predicted Fe-Mo cluster-binding NifX family protein
MYKGIDEANKIVNHFCETRQLSLIKVLEHKIISVSETEKDFSENEKEIQCRCLLPFN